MSDVWPDGLAEYLEKLERSLQSLEGRIVSLEQTLSEDAGRIPEAETTGDQVDVSPAQPESDWISPTLVLTLLGRSLLVLAGAFLLRALTDGGTIPPLIGFALGMAYALTLIVLGDRAGGRGDTASASCYGLTAVIVAYPFLWETTAVLKLVSPIVGGLALTVLTGAGLFVAWRRRLRFLAWAFILAALGTILMLFYATGEEVFYASVLLALGVVTSAFAYTRRWHIKRWVVAFVTDFIIFRLTVRVVEQRDVPPGDETLSIAAVQALAIALLLVYLGMFIYRALVQGRGVRAFDVLQSIAVLLIGFGGAVRISQVQGEGGGILGLAALVAALVAYTVAFTFVRHRHGRGRSFFYFATLALIFLFLGSRVVAEGAWLTWSWVVLGMIMAVLGGHFDRVTLRAHSVVYLFLAAFQTGMLVAALDAFVGPADSDWHGLDTSGVVAILVTAACYIVLVVTQRSRVVSPARRTPRFFAAVLTLIGLGYLVINMLVHLLTGTPPDATPQTVAVVRTVVLSATAVGLAVAGRRAGLAELAWLVYPLLALGCVKLLLEDLRNGSPLTLFIGFAIFGTALIVASRLLLSGRQTAA